MADSMFMDDDDGKNEAFRGRDKHPDPPAPFPDSSLPKEWVRKPIDHTKRALRMIITRGFPGSGKSTWAKKFVWNDDEFIRVNRDDLRVMIFGTNNQWSRGYNKELEEVVRSTRDHLIAGAMCAGFNVVVDETGVYKASLNRLWKLADVIEAECGRPVTVEFQSFLDVPIETCIERDATREFPVGEGVIRLMRTKHLKEQE